MNTPKPSQVLRLYKELLRYGQDLKYTDKPYFYRRIKQEFRKNKSLSENEEILFNFEVCIDLILYLILYGNH